ncbi:hypothetical protein ACU4GD_14635 [Cupriavidus basilensis]
MMAQFELTAEDIRAKNGVAAVLPHGAAPTETIQSSLPPKYQDPVLTGATGRDRGRTPAWRGKNRDFKFLIPRKRESRTPAFGVFRTLCDGRVEGLISGRSGPTLIVTP